MQTRELSTHRVLQVGELADRARHERVAYNIRGLKATKIGNRGAQEWFFAQAKKWEAIRVRADRMLVADMEARAIKAVTA